MTNQEKIDRLIALEKRVEEIQKEDKEMDERKSTLLAEAHEIRREVEQIINSIKP